MSRLVFDDHNIPSGVDNLYVTLDFAMMLISNVDINANVESFSFHGFKQQQRP